MRVASLDRPMQIARDMLDEIAAHAHEEAPNECCGMIGARDGGAVTLYRARNAEASPLRYVVHPQDQFRIMEQMEERGEELGAIYHSHTGSAAYPSQTDINLADGWPDPLYVICSIADPGPPEVRAFAIRDGEVEEVELDVV
jgi:[CysO sulfur-carrier protein]-S-L-cysteine hydrolase